MYYTFVVYPYEISPIGLSAINVFATLGPGPVSNQPSDSGHSCHQTHTLIIIMMIIIIVFVMIIIIILVVMIREISQKNCQIR